ncbi:MAG: PASTA domain-containing protein [Ruminococcaceae bacterium]|nr:PASTA domain-containing protein [Oscillospiraceae bacterium]
MYTELNKMIARRSMVLLACFAAAWLLLCARLFLLQIVDYEKYQQNVIDSIQRTSEVSAERGQIYDRNMTVLATNVTVWRVFISPVDIEDDTQARFIARGLSEILNVDYDTILTRARKENRADETVKRNVEKEEADQVRAFIAENELSQQIHLQATAKRYYPYDSLASSVLGFTGTDGGSYGVELTYDSLLQGIPGRYITAKNGLGMDMPFKYESYIEAQNGYNVVTTLDMNIQYLLEKQLDACLADSNAAGGVSGIVMDVNTGGILGMSTKPDYNLNAPGQLSELLLQRLAEYEVGSEEYNAKYNELMFSTWNNKNVSWLYEPGSTFKIITASIALEENTSKLSDTFTCTGKAFVPGYSQPIHCHKTTGHGTQNFARALQQSCNPALIAINERNGRELFWEYFNAFGYTGKTGVDMPGEASGLYVGVEQLNAVEMAVYSFGQTFKVTPLQQLTAIAAVANGGKLVTPHILEKVTDEKNNVIESYETKVRRQVLSEATCTTMTNILEEGVSGDGGAKNAYVLGYKVAAKTGTSQVRDILDENGQSYLHVGSCVAFAPADDPQVAVLILCDQPMNSNIYGSIVAAPYVSDLLEEVLPYIGIERSYTAEEEARMQVNVWDYSGFTVESAILNCRNQGLKYEVVGNGTKVVSQVPRGGSQVLMSTGKVIFYTDGSAELEGTIPSVVGLNATQANARLTNAGFNIKVEGAQNYESGAGAKVVEQLPAGGEKAAKGSVVTVRFMHVDGTD